jgi:hypothetical protein
VTGDSGRTAGSGLRARRRARRSAAAFLFALFVVANPAYFCPINCLLRHDGDHAGRHGHVVMMGDACHPGPQVTPQQAPTGRELSPGVPAVAADLPVESRELESSEPGRVLAVRHFRGAPPPPPPRA